MPDTDWTTARYADGPTLAGFLDRLLERRAEDPGMYGDTVTRTLYAWRRGERRRAHFSTVDGLLVRLGLHPSELPQEVWR